MDVILYKKISNVENETHGIKEAAFKTEYQPKETTTTDINPQLTWVDGYVAYGRIYESSDFQYTRINVLPEDILTTKDGGDLVTIMFVQQMDGENVVATETNQRPAVVQEGVDSVYLSVAKAYTTKSNFHCYLTRTEYTEKIVLDIDNAPTENSNKPVTSGGVFDALQSIEQPMQNGIVLKFDLASGATYGDPQERSLEDECGYSVSFFAKLTGNLEGQIIIGKGYGHYDGAAIGIDNTNVYVYLNGATSGTPSSTKQHNITAFSDYISVVLDVGYVADECKVRIKTNGAESTVTPSFWRSQEGILSVYSSDDALTDCILSYAVPALDNEIWMYGDSYFSEYNNARWTYWLVSEGHTKFLLNAYPGRQSPAALASLELDLATGKKPKKIIWCMGMNDKDGESEPNTNWKNAVEYISDICNRIGAELILATIPNVPSTATKNTLKNAYVAESNKRYIDFANAISADGSNTWYTNMLNSDNVHPLKEGAKALYGAAVTAVPELLK